MISFNYLYSSIENMKRGVYSPLSVEKILAKTHHLYTKGNLTVKEYRWLLMECESLIRSD
jgi:hypothetical protein